MPIQVPNLDDRRFADLVAEARERLAAHVPELQHIVPGDPTDAFIDLFAWLTETIIYRANLIPERQRRAFLSLLRIPPRSARAARGVVCLDVKKGHDVAALVPDGSRLDSKPGATFSTVGEVSPTPLEAQLVVKRGVSNDELAAAGITQSDLAKIYPMAGMVQGRGTTNDGEGDNVIRPFRPTPLTIGVDELRLEETVDHAVYVALIAKGDVAPTREALADVTINLAVAPPTRVPEDDSDDRVVDESIERRRPTRRLMWHFGYSAEGEARWLRLDDVADSSQGGRRAGVARLRLPRALARLTPPVPVDPKDIGVGDFPPELRAGVDADVVMCWLRLTCPDDPELRLGYLDINGVEVVAQVWTRDLVVGRGDGTPDQVFALGQQFVDAESLAVDIEGADGRWSRWQLVERASTDRARVVTLDAEAGQVAFRGERVPDGRRVRATFRHGGGLEGNLPREQIHALVGGPASQVTVRQHWPTAGGTAAETQAEAERRIPAFLAHRDRAVTAGDYRQLARETPVVDVARADVIGGMIPNVSPALVRRDIPGALSVFVLPPAEPALHASPRASLAMLREVYEFLAERSVIGTQLHVLSPEYRPVAVSVGVRVVDPQREAEVLRACERAVVEFLWALPPGGPTGDGWPLGRTVEATEIATRVARVDGVLAVRAIRLFHETADGWFAVPDGQPLTLHDFQLPEPVGVSASPDDTPLAPPPELAPTDNAPRAVPAPVVPDLC